MKYLKKHRYITAGTFSLMIHAFAFFLLLPDEYILQSLESLVPPPKIKLVQTVQAVQTVQTVQDVKEVIELKSSGVFSKIQKKQTRVINKITTDDQGKEEPVQNNINIVVNNESVVQLAKEIKSQPYEKKISYEQYMNEIRKKIEENIIYPKFLKNTGASGKVILQIVIDGNGNLTKVEIVSSSGEELFNREAIRSVKKSAPFLSPPVSEFAVQIPIVFDSNLINR